jgi:hypothetical protein
VLFDADHQLKLNLAHDILQHPDKFAEVFVKAAQTQVSVKQLIRTEIRECLASDVDSIKYLKSLIADHIKEDWKAFLRTWIGKIALLMWTVLVALIGVLVGRLFK